MDRIECSCCEFVDQEDGFCNAFIEKQKNCFNVSHFKLVDYEPHMIARKYIYVERHHKGITYHRLIIDEGMVQ